MSKNKIITETPTEQAVLHSDFIKSSMREGGIFILAAFCLVAGVNPTLAFVVLGLLIGGEHAPAILAAGLPWPKA